MLYFTWTQRLPRESSVASVSSALPQGTHARWASLQPAGERPHSPFIRSRSVPRTAREFYVRDLIQLFLKPIYRRCSASDMEIQVQNLLKVPQLRQEPFLRLPMSQRAGLPDPKAVLLLPPSCCKTSGGGLWRGSQGSSSYPENGICSVFPLGAVGCTQTQLIGTRGANIHHTLEALYSLLSGSAMLQLGS